MSDRRHLMVITLGRGKRVFNAGLCQNRLRLQFEH